MLSPANASANAYANAYYLRTQALVLLLSSNLFHELASLHSASLLAITISYHATIPLALDFPSSVGFPLMPE
jgi:hypothetical protein